MKIKTLKQLARLATEKRSVTYGNRKIRVPAAVAMNFLGTFLFTQMELGAIELYTKQKPKHERTGLWEKI